MDQTTEPDAYYSDDTKTDEIDMSFLDDQPEQQ